MSCRGAARIACLVGTLLVALASLSSAARAATLDVIRETRQIRLAFREDAPPFSVLGADKKAAGFMIDLCGVVATQIGKQLSIDLKVVYVPVTAANRFETIAQGKADILCEATTATLGRREMVDFSIPTFIDGASLMIRAGGPAELRAMAKRKVGVLGGTTTEAALRALLRRDNIDAEVVLMTSHREGVAQLDDDKIVAYFADHAILMYAAGTSKAPQQLRIADQFLTQEPYALALPRGDGAFRLAVDRALSHIYRSGEIVPIFRATFGADAKPSQLLQMLYVIAPLPD